MGLYIHLMKLKYTHHTKAGMLQPTRQRRSVKIIKTEITYNRLDSTCGIPDNALTSLFCKAINKELANRKSQHLPIALYDKFEKKAYLQYPDGRKVYV